MPATSIIYYVIISNLISAWLTVKARATRWRAEEAEQHATGRPRLMPKNDMVLLRQAYFLANKKELTDKKCPSRMLVEARLAELEDGVLVPEQLHEIVSVEENNGDKPAKGNTHEAL